jgi:hypothetical protein
MQKNFSRTLQYNNRALTAEILADMDQLEALDKVYEFKERACKIGMISGLVVGGLGLLLVFVLAGNAPLGWLPVLPVAAFLLAGLAVMRWRVCRRFNLDNRRYQLVRQLIQYLSKDISSGQPYRVSIDFNHYRQAKYCTARQGGGILSSATLSSYKLPWLMFEGTFVDGNRFCLSLTMVAKYRSVRKRKYTKVREVFREEVLLKLRVKPRPYRGVEQWPALVAHPPFAPEEHGLRFNGARMRGAWLVLSAITDRQVRMRGRSGTTGENATDLLASRHGILGMFLACYNALAQCAPGT